MKTSNKQLVALHQSPKDAIQNLPFNSSGFAFPSQDTEDGAASFKKCQSEIGLPFMLQTQ